MRRIGAMRAFVSFNDSPGGCYGEAMLPCPAADHIGAAALSGMGQRLGSEPLRFPTLAEPQVDRRRSIRVLLRDERPGRLEVVVCLEPGRCVAIPRVAALRRQRCDVGRRRDSPPVIQPARQEPADPHPDLAIRLCRALRRAAPRDEGGERRKIEAEIDRELPVLGRVPGAALGVHHTSALEADATPGPGRAAVPCRLESWSQGLGQDGVDDASDLRHTKMRVAA